MGLGNNSWVKNPPVNDLPLGGKPPGQLYPIPRSPGAGPAGRPYILVHFASFKSPVIDLEICKGSCNFCPSISFTSKL